MCNISSASWIKYPEHQNPNLEGYIGITSQSIKKRLNDHKHNNKNKPRQIKITTTLFKNILIQDYYDHSNSLALRRSLQLSLPSLLCLVLTLPL